MNQKLKSLLKPNTIFDLIGYSNLVSNDGIFAKMIENKFIFSFLLFGEPGIGKTSLANILANQFTEYTVLNINAAQDNKKELNQLLERSKLGFKTIVVIDEIHSLNKSNQDFLLNFLENDFIYIFATTTENPYVAINPALRSRMHIFELKKQPDLILDDFYNKIQQLELKNKYKKEDIEKILKYSQYDIRNAINILDIIDNLYDFTQIDDDFLNKIGIMANYNSGKNTSELHDLKSAFQKSIRGSDVDASLYYLGCLIKFNDLKTLTRRLQIIAYEDIGLANPNLCMRVVVGCNSALNVGFPEVNLILAPLVIEMALSPKSNSGTISINNVLEFLKHNPVLEIPNHLRDSHYCDANNIVRDKYLFPHNYKNHYVEQRYLPKNVNKKFYEYDFSNDNENKLNKNFEIWSKRNKI